MCTVADDHFPHPHLLYRPANKLEIWEDLKIISKCFSVQMSLSVSE